ncbi:Rieske domain-containing protein [Seiridium cupressi]
MYVDTEHTQYHGWQYDTTGSLLKAPEFMDMPGFDKADNGLFEIHLRIDSNGFIFVNFATHLTDAFAWSDNTVIPFLPRLSHGDVNEWTLEVDISWMMASLLPWFMGTRKLHSIFWKERLIPTREDSGKPQFYYVDDASFICELGKGSFLLISALPLSENKTKLRCIYTVGGTKCTLTQLRDVANAEIWKAIASLRHYRPIGVSLDYRQSAIRERLDKLGRHVNQHRALELTSDRTINPSARANLTTCRDDEAESICATLVKAGPRAERGCLVSQQEDLEW